MNTYINDRISETTDDEVEYINIHEKMEITLSQKTLAGFLTRIKLQKTV